MSAHSPAPWSARPDIGLIFDGKGHTIGSMIFLAHLSAAEKQANINLMVAAPALLAALQAVEWGGSTLEFLADDHVPACPFCNALKSSGIHTADCLMDIALRRARDGAR